MKKLLLILSFLITANTLFAQVNTGQKIVIKVGGGGSTDLSNYFTKGQIDSINAGYYTKSQVDSIVATINATVHINNSAEITYTGTGTSGNPFVFSIDSLNVGKLNGGKIDTAHIPISTIHIINQGTGITTIRGSHDTLYSPTISGAGTVSVTKQADSSILITGTGGVKNIYVDQQGILGDTLFWVKNDSTLTSVKVRDSTGIITGYANDGAYYIMADTSYLKSIIGVGGTGTPAGSSGYVQFNNSGSFGGNGSLFWDNTNKRLGIGTSTPLHSLDVYGNTGVTILGVGDVTSAESGAKPLIYLQTDATNGITSFNSRWNYPFTILVHNIERMRIDTNGNTGFGLTVPTATVHIKAGTSTAGTAPLKLTSGTNLTTPEAGVFEFNGTNLFFTPNTTRNSILMTGSVNTISPTTPDRTLTVVIDGTTYYIPAKTTND